MKHALTNRPFDVPALHDMETELVVEGANQALRTLGFFKRRLNSLVAPLSKAHALVEANEAVKLWNELDGLQTTLFALLKDHGSVEEIRKRKDVVWRTKREWAGKVEVLEAVKRKLYAKETADANSAN